MRLAGGFRFARRGALAAALPGLALSACGSSESGETVAAAQIGGAVEKPNLTLGLKVDLPRPRDRKALLDHPRFHQYRQEVLHFLAEYDHGPAAKAA
jgi:hypothetical protein